MEFEFEFENLNKIIEDLQGLADTDELDNLGKEVVTEVANTVKPILQSQIPVSNNHQKSGKYYKDRGRVTPASHSKDVLPMSNYKKGTNSTGSIILGWTNPKNDNFYIKFEEFGTTKLPAQHFFRGSYKLAFDLIREVGIPKYSELLNRKLGGD